MRKIRRLKTVGKFIAVAFLLASIISVNLFYYSALRKQISSANTYSKQQVIGGISDYYTQVHVVLSTLLGNPHLSSLESLESKKEAYRSDSASEVISLVALLNSMPDAIEYIYIYLESVDLIVSSDGIIERDIFYDVMGKRYASSMEEWDSITTKPKAGQELNMVGDNAIFTVKQYFDGSNVPYTLGVIADLEDIFIDNTYAEWISAANVYIFDRYGTLSLMNENIEIASLDDVQNRNDILDLRDEYDSLYQTVVVGDKQYDVVFLFEKGLDMRLVNLYQMLLIIIMLVSGAILLYFIYLQVVEKYRPLKELAEILKIDASDMDFKLLYKPIQNIVNDNEELNRLVEDKNSILNRLTFERLLSGNLKGISNEVLAKLGLHFQYNGFMVVLLHVYNDMNATANTKQEIENTIVEELKTILGSENSVAYLVSMNEYVIGILNIDTEMMDMATIKNMFEQFIERADIKDDYVISLVVSDICDELWQISLLYSNVLDVIRKSELSRNSGVVFCSDCESLGVVSGIGITREPELVFAIKNGNYAAAEEVIHWYIDGNHDNQNRSLDLIYILIRMGENNSAYRTYMQTIFMALKNIEDAEVVRKACCDFVKKICEDVMVDAKQKNLSGVIRELIHDNYEDSNFCLESICDTLGFSAVHLNNIFKEEHNMTIVMYLSNYRMQKAKEFILEGKAIKDVVEMVGISNARTFNRLFLSATNMTPTEYRNKIKENKKEKE